MNSNMGTGTFGPVGKIYMYVYIYIYLWSGITIKGIYLMRNLEEKMSLGTLKGN